MVTTSCRKSSWVKSSSTESRLSDRKLKPLPPDPFRHQDSAIARGRCCRHPVFGAVFRSVLAHAAISAGRPLEPGAWLRGGVTYVALAMNLVPFAGVAFLWFVGVLRDRLGAREDRFFATVFLGS